MNEKIKLLAEAFFLVERNLKNLKHVIHGLLETQEDYDVFDWELEKLKRYNDKQI